MKCLLCNFNSNEPNEVREHYIDYKNDYVDTRTNSLRRFFKKLETFFMERGV